MCSSPPNEIWNTVRVLSTWIPSRSQQDRNSAVLFSRPSIRLLAFEPSTYSQRWMLSIGQSIHKLLVLHYRALDFALDFALGLCRYFSSIMCSSGCKPIPAEYGIGAASSGGSLQHHSECVLCVASSLSMRLAATSYAELDTYMLVLRVRWYSPTVVPSS